MEARRDLKILKTMWGIEKINTREEFQNLAPEWNSLLLGSDANTIALTHEWLSTWWDIFGAGRELCILLVRDGETLIGIAPLLKRRISSFGLGVTRLEFLASGEDEADEICSDYLDFILESGREKEALNAIFHYLREVETDWDELLLKEILSTSPTTELLGAQCENAGLKCEVSGLGEAVYLPLEQGWEALEKSLPRRMRSQLRQDERKAQAHGYTLEIAESAADFESAFANFKMLHQKLWQERGFPGVFASENFTRFHRELAAKISAQGQLRLYLLKAENQAVAALQVFVYAGKASYYQSGFDSHGALHSPGTLLHTRAIRHSIETGLGEWDFLKAEPGDYKYRWSRHTRKLYQIRIAKLQAKETVRASATFVANELRKVKQALKR